MLLMASTSSCVFFFCRNIYFLTQLSANQPFQISAANQDYGEWHAFLACLHVLISHMLKQGDGLFFGPNNSSKRTLSKTPQMLTFINPSKNGVLG